MKVKVGKSESERGKIVDEKLREMRKWENVCRSCQKMQEDAKTTFQIDPLKQHS